MILEFENKKEEELTKDLANRFERLCQQLNLSRSEAKRSYLLWQKLHGEEQRYYHNQKHISNFLGLLDSYKEGIKDRLCFEIAIWWHDAIYRVERKDNEWESAVLVQNLWGAYLTSEQLDRVGDLINSTAGHRPLRREQDFYYFLDFDLGILATAKTSYQQYSEAIAKEYRGVYSREVYEKGRKVVLLNFLKRPRIFFSDLFCENYEKQARDNIKLEMEFLL